MVNQEEYRQMIQDLCDFLNGRTDPIVNRLTSEMNAASEGMRYEKAAAIRDQLTAIDNVVQRQKVISRQVPRLRCDCHGPLRP